VCEVKHSQELMDFIRSPDTIDFIARGTDAFLQLASNNLNIVITQVLSGRYVVGYVHEDYYPQLMKLLGTGFISASSIVLGTLDRPVLDASGIQQVHRQPYLSLRGRGVLLGFVDTGIDYTQEVFRYEDGTSKIQFIYDQTADGDPPADFFLGREYSNQEINEALQSENPLALVSETDEDGHGTFLASVAAGREIGDFAGTAPDAEIIAVKLRPARPFYRKQLCVPKKQEAAFESSAVMVGVEYILKKARQLGRPVVICLGIGTNFGSHDGFSIFEEYLSGVSNQRGVCLVAAAGNESQERHHMSGKMNSAGETQNLDIKVGNSAGDICVSVWNTVADRLSASVRSPSGELVGRIPARPGVQNEVKLVLEPTRIHVEYHFPIEGSSGQLTYIRILDATPGIWTIALHGDIVLDGTFHAWLPMTGFVADGVEFLSASPYHTVVVPATAAGAITCGAYDTEQQSLYGPTAAPTPHIQWSQLMWRLL
jgi:hypothetical protein